MADIDGTLPIVPAPVESRKDADDKPDLSKFWLGELSAAEKRDDDWCKRARKVVQRYRDERSNDTLTSGSYDASAVYEKRTNILWSNTELLKSALFQGLGNPDVRRRFPKKGKDEKVTKQTALVMERAAAYSNDAFDTESQIDNAIEDMVLPGRGVVWIVYDALIGKNPDTDEDEVQQQTVRCEHVYWEDFRISSGRKWSDVWWAARCHYYSRDDLTKYWPKHADKIPLNSQIQDTTADRKRDQDDTFKRAKVWEIWDKSKRQRNWVAEDYLYVLDKEDDPYRLEHFWPCAEPLYGVKTTSSLVPVPEFCLYQDQANELDQVATRLSALIEALKRRGVYDAGVEGSDNQLSQLAYAKDNEFVPYRGFAAMMEKGGLKAVFQTEDLAPIVTAIEGLYKRAADLVQQIYEITGISDIMRGASDAAETAAAQQIKASFGSMRLQKRQRRVNRFIRELTRIKTEIIAEHFTRDQLEQMVGIDLPLNIEKQQAQMQLNAFAQQQQMAQQAAQHPPMPAGPPQGAPGGQPPQGAPIPLQAQNAPPGPPRPPGMPPVPPQPGTALVPQMAPPPPPDPDLIAHLQEIIKLPSWEDVSAILRSDLRRGYKIDVETDETAQADENAEKSARMEFLSTMTQQLETAIPMAMQMPPMRPLIKESVMFAVKAFKAGRPLEEAFDEAFSQLEHMPPPPPQPNPAQSRAQVDQAKAAEIQMRTKLTMQDAQQAQQQAAQEAQQSAQKNATDLQIANIEAQSKAADVQTQAQNAQADRAMKMQEAQFALGRQIEKAQMEKEMEAANRDLAAVMGHLEVHQAAHDLHASRQSHQMDMLERHRRMNQPQQPAGR